MHYNPQTDFIEISVRELCALAFKGGSLDNRVPPVDLYRRAEEGRETHERLRALREAGKIVLVQKMNKNVGFQKQKLEAEGYSSFIDVRYPDEIETKFN